MLNWEYDAEAEKRVIREEGYAQGYTQGYRQGYQQVVEMYAKLLKEGFSSSEALERIDSILVSPPPS